MIVQFEWILIGVFRKEGNGVVVEVVDRWAAALASVLLKAYPSIGVDFFGLFCFLQVRDEYRTDYDPDIL